MDSVSRINAREHTSAPRRSKTVTRTPPRNLRKWTDADAHVAGASLGGGNTNTTPTLHPTEALTPARSHHRLDILSRCAILCLRRNARINRQDLLRQRRREQRRQQIIDRVVNRKLELTL